MISPEEEKFYLQWEKDRVLPHFKHKPFLKGLSLSLLFGILILILTELGWYERANMIANRSGNGIWMLIAIVIFSFGFAWIYQQFTFEMNEQRFHEIKNLKNKK
jgi:hypothetical protein